MAPPRRWSGGSTGIGTRTPECPCHVPASYRQVRPKWLKHVGVCARRAGGTREALAGPWQGHTGVRVPSRRAPTPHLRGGHEGPRIEIACRRLPRPTTAHPVLAYPPHTLGPPWLAWLRPGRPAAAGSSGTCCHRGSRRLGGGGVHGGQQHTPCRNRMVTGCAHHSTYPMLSLLDQI